MIHAEVAIAIALCSTALGTLLPIMKDGGLLGTPVGKAVMNHGAWGELGPVVAMAILLGTGGAGQAIVAIIMFGLIALPSPCRGGGSGGTPRRCSPSIQAGSETTGQTTVRLTVLLLVALCVLAELFQLDVVLGAFAAGFVLRQAIPQGDEQLEHKLNGLAFGMLIPVFFVTSGMAIDARAVAAAPSALIVFVLLIVAVRGLPVFVSSRLERDRVSGARLFGTRESVRIGLFAATGLPIIVAVTTTAVSAGQMSQANASVLVAGGAVTVLTMPLLATLLGGRDRGVGRQSVSPRFTEVSSSWATSSTSTSSRASPACCSAVSPSDSITRQNGQPTAIWSAPVATASLVRLTLIRSPSFSSIHIRPPPAPQQKDRSLLRRHLLEGGARDHRRAARAAGRTPGCAGPGSTGRGT